MPPVMPPFPAGGKPPQVGGFGVQRPRRRGRLTIRNCRAGRLYSFHADRTTACRRACFRRRRANKTPPVSGTVARGHASKEDAATAADSSAVGEGAAAHSPVAAENSSAAARLAAPEKQFLPQRLAKVAALGDYLSVEDSVGQRCNPPGYRPKPALHAGEQNRLWLASGWVRHSGLSPREVVSCFSSHLRAMRLTSERRRPMMRRGLQSSFFHAA